jgi:hypothetical protein
MESKESIVITENESNKSFGIEHGELPADDFEYLFKGKFDIDSISKGNQYLSFEINKNFLSSKDYYEVMSLLEKAGIIISKALDKNSSLVIDLYNLSNELESIDDNDRLKINNAIIKSMNNIVNKQVSLEDSMKKNEENWEKKFKNLYSCVGELNDENLRIAIGIAVCTIVATFGYITSTVIDYKFFLMLIIFWFGIKVKCIEIPSLFKKIISCRKKLNDNKKRMNLK